MRKVIAVMAVAIFMFFAANVFADDLSGQGEAMVIENSKGEYLGTVTNLLIDSSGNIVFVIVSQDRMESMAQKDIAVPLGAFTYDQDQKRVVLEISKEQLDAAPEFTASELNDPFFPHRVYQFFGQAPLWSDGKPNGVPGTKG